ncbi:hypothetical protein DI487_11805 [Flavobacterium sediminis]|uniref:Uncharacterized protein n=1 Tax=Flavobacterium sediminis TaxID=2201181 RepID=A0A2U8QW89_9FLAO|nr:hypothetical protein [Flavobacterium sediminis]AWM14472.1 hypothetical protein DI487_11805 [Flavobacterium sediminis]
MGEEVIVKPEVKSSNKKAKLVLSIIFDLIGMMSYLVPVFGEAVDVIWAPISGLLLMLMYKGTKGKVAGIIGTIEELIPFIDIIPTFTLTWLYTYFIQKEE